MARGIWPSFPLKTSPPCDPLSSPAPLAEWPAGRLMSRMLHFHLSPSCSGQAAASTIGGMKRQPQNHAGYEGRRMNPVAERRSPTGGEKAFFDRENLEGRLRYCRPEIALVGVPLAPASKREGSMRIVGQR